MTAPVRVAAASELRDGTPIRVEVDGVPICLVRDGDGVHALYDLCSHADVSLSEGEVDDGAVECWLHGSRFDLVTGQPTGLPATTAVPVYTALTRGDDVLVALIPPPRS
jgi:3-phenylpropionate/trans-cinnamate dioxygenase ferredoxin subunit